MMPDCTQKKIYHKAVTKMLSINYLLLTSICIRTCFAYDLTILHTNDVHARIEETNKYGAKCSKTDQEAAACYGGVARRFTAIKEIRRTHKNVVLLDAGDQFQGTLWFNMYKGTEARIFMNRLGYDAMAFGNHEFDNGVDGAVSFMKKINFPLLAANMNVSLEPKWPKGHLRFKKSIVLSVGNENVGVIGYTTTDNSWLSAPGPNIIFTDEIDAVRKEARRLAEKGINKIIALGHAGIELDKIIAEDIPEVDVVVGGHTHTFLYTGIPPSNEVPYGPYPVVVNKKNDPSKMALVVQDYTYGKYLGNLQVVFDSDGDIVRYSGNPMLLNSSFTPDPEMATDVRIMGAALDKFSKEPIGKTHVFLDGRREVCRSRECNLGNLITDAFVYMYRRAYDERHWADVSIAMWGGGGIRNPIDLGPNEPITSGHILSVLPFGNTADILELKGRHLLDALEHSVHNYNPQFPAGAFLQVSGIHVEYDLSKPPGRRVSDVKLRCSKCRVPRYEPLNKTRIYKVITSTYYSRGGDNYQVFPKHTIRRHAGELATSLVSEYIKQMTPIIIGTEERIKFVNMYEDRLSGRHRKKENEDLSDISTNYVSPETASSQRCSAHKSYATPSIVCISLIICVLISIFRT